MSLNKEEALTNLRAFISEYKDNFFDDNGLEQASVYCRNLLLEKVMRLANKHFGFRDPRDLIEIVNCINEEKSTQTKTKGKGKSKEK